MKLIKFPKDELSHKHAIEWWYFNGHLEDRQHNKYAFMHCLFKIDAKKAKIPLLSRAPFKYIYFSHSILSDLRHKKFYPAIDFLIVSEDSFIGPLLFINYMNPLAPNAYFSSTIEEVEKFEYHIKTKTLNLALKSAKMPLLEGGNGLVKLGTKKVFYYSLTNLKTSGTIKVKNRAIKVRGKSWMDHQWLGAGYSHDKWIWFSVQLENNIEIVCFEYEDKGAKARLASISYSGNKQENTNEIKLTSLGETWTSPKTKIQYPLSWRIEIPSKNINLVARPFIKDQEMIFGLINYWEGPMKIDGIFNGKKAKGLGFLELVAGYSKYNWLRFFKNILAKGLAHIVHGG